MFAGDNVNQELLAVKLESRFRYVEEGESTAAGTAGPSPFRKSTGSAQYSWRQTEQVRQELDIFGWGLDAGCVLKCSGHLGVELRLADHFCRGTSASCGSGTRPDKGGEYHKMDSHSSHITGRDGRCSGDADWRCLSTVIERWRLPRVYMYSEERRVQEKEQPKGIL
ncbi:hypothetical protein K438DRAFT_1776369 [Mycena galopus ATCC 62051]|nr:hypothetical protein K438DRAFT_1776369 [Mycena galopus ATCC 62051]